MALSYEETQEAMRKLGEQLRALEAAHAEAVESAADAEAVYRRALAAKVDEFRTAGLSVEHAQTKARAECYVLSAERDKAAGKVRTVLEQMENRRGERESLHRLVAWSHSVFLRAQ